MVGARSPWWWLVSHGVHCGGEVPGGPGPWSRQVPGTRGPWGPSRASRRCQGAATAPPGLCAVAAVLICVGRKPHNTLLSLFKQSVIF